MAPDLIGLSEKDYKTLSKIANALGIEYKKKETPTIEQIADLNADNWIKVPQEFSNLKYSFSVSSGRISYNPAVEKVGKELDLKLKDTAKDSLGRPFVGNINWDNSLKLNLMLGNKTTNPLEHFKFLELINKGAKGEIPVYTVSGKRLESKDLQTIRDDIINPRSPWRAEWHDTDFKFRDGKYYIYFNHELKNGNLVPRNKPLLAKNTLIENKRINLDSLLGNTTKEGLPKKSIESGDFYYWGPDNDNNSVARSGAYVVGAGFYCVRYRSFAGPFLGVRASKKLE